MASPSKDATPSMWDIMSSEDDKTMMEKFTAESNKVINRWFLGDATFTEKDAAVSFLVQLGAVEITILPGSQQTTSQTQVSILFGDGGDTKIDEEHHHKADPEDTKDAIQSEKDVIPSEGYSVRPVPDSSDQDAEKKNEIPVRLDQDTKKNGEAQVNEDDDDDEVEDDEDSNGSVWMPGPDDDDDDDNNYSVRMTEPDEHDDDENQIPDPAPVVEESSTTQPREGHPCLVCHTVFHSLWELDLHKLSCFKKQIYNCDQCSKSFTSKGFAVKHLQKVHNMSDTEAVEKLTELKSTERQKYRREKKKKKKTKHRAKRRVEKKLLLKLQPLSSELVKILENETIDINELQLNSMDNKLKETTAVSIDKISCKRNTTSAVDEESEVSESVPRQVDVKEKSLSTMSALENNADHGCTSEQVQEKDKSSELLGDKDQVQGYSGEQVRQEHEDESTPGHVASQGQSSDLNMAEIKVRSHTFEELVESSIGVKKGNETKQVNSKYNKYVTALTCKLCNLQFKSAHSRNEHMRECHIEHRHRFKCSTCNKSFKDKSKFITHLENHNDREKYQCLICNKSILRKHYEIHMETHAERKKETCTCDTCGRVFCSKRNLERHVNTQHKKEVVYTCEICGKNIYSTSYIKRHLETHTDQRTWKCDKCRYSSYHKDKLDQHKQLVHTTGGKLLCEICGSAFKHRPSLKKHIRTSHSTTYNYSCDLCDMKFKSSTHVYCHKVSVHSYKPKNKSVRYGNGPSKPSTTVSDSAEISEVGDVGHHEICDSVSHLSEASDSQVIREALLAMINH